MERPTEFGCINPNTAKTLRLAPAQERGSRRSYSAVPLPSGTSGREKSLSVDPTRVEEEWLGAWRGLSVRREPGKYIRETFGVELTVPFIPLPRVSVEEACAMFFEPRSVEIRDLDSDMERRLAAYVAETRAHDFVFVVDYGAKGRTFYDMRHSADSGSFGTARSITV